jgi:MOSC domain-containing protein YiiM
MKQLTMTELEAGLAEILESPQDNGRLAMIVIRPSEDEREILENAELSESEGLVGDNWLARGSKRTADGSAKPDAQITIMNARAAALIAQDRERWPLAGDQLFVDMDLSDENLPAGQKIAVGTAVLEITALPHTGCKKFAQRFGKDAVIFANSEEGKRWHLRGIYARVIQTGKIQAGDTVRKV